MLLHLNVGRFNGLGYSWLFLNLLAGFDSFAVFLNGWILIFLLGLWSLFLLWLSSIFAYFLQTGPFCANSGVLSRFLSFSARLRRFWSLWFIILDNGRIIVWVRCGLFLGLLGICFLITLLLLCFDTHSFDTFLLFSLKLGRNIFTFHCLDCNLRARWLLRLLLCSAVMAGKGIILEVWDFSLQTGIKDQKGALCIQFNSGLTRLMPKQWGWNHCSQWSQPIITAVSGC